MGAKEDYEKLIKNFLGKGEYKDEKEKEFERRKALAKLISIVENEPEKAEYIFNKLPKGNAYLIGITGPPGSGKSSLINKLAGELVKDGKSLGILLIDPSSPFSDGAFLGDRLRISDIASNPNVFIRSMASRGGLGGISRAAYDVAQLFSAYGNNYVIIESVGAGQSDVEIHDIVYTTLVLNVPGLGDSIQAQKAGILEIGDILVVNKKDKGGEEIAVQLDIMLDDSVQYVSKSGWRPPVVQTNSLTGEGIHELKEEIINHKEYMELGGFLEEKKKKIIEKRIFHGLQDMIYKFVSLKLDNKKIKEFVEDICAGKENIYSVIKKLYIFHLPNLKED